jgi:hypothetical protein
MLGMCGCMFDPDAENSAQATTEKDAGPITLDQLTLQNFERTAPKLIEELSKESTEQTLTLLIELVFSHGQKVDVWAKFFKALLDKETESKNKIAHKLALCNQIQTSSEELIKQDPDESNESTQLKFSSLSSFVMLICKLNLLGNASIKKILNTWVGDEHTSASVKAATQLLRLSGPNMDAIGQLDESLISRLTEIGASYDPSVQSEVARFIQFKENGWK